MNRKLLKRILVTSAIAILGVNTSFAALVMERDQSVDTAPSVGMYKSLYNHQFLFLFPLAVTISLSVLWSSQIEQCYCND